MSKITFEEVTNSKEINELFVKSSEKVYMHWTDKLIHDIGKKTCCYAGPSVLHIVGGATSAILASFHAYSDVKIYKAVIEADNDINTLIVVKSENKSGSKQEIWIVSPSRIVMKDRLHAAFADWYNVEKVHIYDVDFSEATDTRSIFAGCSSLQEVRIVNCILDNDADISNMFDIPSVQYELNNIQLDIKFAHVGDARLRMDNLVSFSDTNTCKLKITGIEMKDLAESDLPIVWADNALSTSGAELISTSDPKLKEYIIERLRKQTLESALIYKKLIVRTKNHATLNKADEIKIFAGLLNPLDKYEYLNYTIDRLKILLRVGAFRMDVHDTLLLNRLETLYDGILNEVDNLRRKNKTVFEYTSEELAALTPQHEAYRFISLLPGYYKLGWNAFAPDYYVKAFVGINYNISDAAWTAPVLGSVREAALSLSDSPYESYIGADDTYEFEVSCKMCNILADGYTHGYSDGIIPIFKDTVKSTAEMLLDYKYGIPRCAYHRYMAYISPMINFFDFRTSNEMSVCSLMLRTLKVLEGTPGLNREKLNDIRIELTREILPISNLLDEFDDAIETFVCSFGGVNMKTLNQYRAWRYATGKKKEAAQLIEASTIAESTGIKCPACYGTVINNKCTCCNRVYQTI